MPLLFQFAREESMRNLQQNARSIACIRLAALAAAMLHILEHRQRLAE